MTRGTRVLLGVLTPVICVGAACPAALARVGASPSADSLASRLIRLDPGARLGANTQVATAAGARLLGVRSRVNFIIGLGPRQRIVGGARGDQLGAHGGTGARISGGRGNDLIHGGRGRQLLSGGPGGDIVNGAAGNDTIHGGPGADVIQGGAGRDIIRGGPGRNRITDRQGATVVAGGSGANYIDVADGGRDRVLCAAGSRNRLLVDRGDRLGPGCRSRASAVRYRRPPSNAAPTQASPVTGEGSNSNPFVAPCSDPASVDCTVNAFARRFLRGLWANEYVPAYKCPTDHPYLRYDRYVPAGVIVPPGVEIDQGLGPGGGAWPIGILIGSYSETRASNGTIGTGTFGGFTHSSATNWSTGTASYKVILHCTSDSTRGWVTALP